MEITSPEHTEGLTEHIASVLDRDGLLAAEWPSKFRQGKGRTIVRDDNGTLFVLTLQPVCEHVANDEQPEHQSSGKCWECTI